MSRRDRAPVRLVSGIAATVLVVGAVAACTAPGGGAVDPTGSDPAGGQDLGDVVRAFREPAGADDAPPAEMSPLRRYGAGAVRRVGEVGAAQAYAAAAGDQVCLVLGLPEDAEEWRTGSACTTVEDFAQRGLTLSVESADPQGRWDARAMLVADGFDTPHEGWASVGPNLWVATVPPEQP